MIFSKGYSLALDFHENSKAKISPNSFDKNMPFKIYPNSEFVNLEKNCLKFAECTNDTFLRTILNRKSTRSFSEKPITIKELSRLLTLGVGIRDHADSRLPRTYACAGARYPIETYVFMLKSGDIEPGVYHYNIFSNSLETLRKGDYSGAIYDFYGNQNQHVSMNFPCLILFSIVFKRSMDKYGERGYRFSLIDAGHMSQNLYLVSEYLGLGIVAFGAGKENDNKLDELLGLVSEEENAFYGFAIGHSKL